MDFSYWVPSLPVYFCPCLVSALTPNTSTPLHLQPFLPNPFLHPGSSQREGPSAPAPMCYTRLSPQSSPPRRATHDPEKLRIKETLEIKT